MPFWAKKNIRHGMDENGRTPLWHLAAHGDYAGVLTALAAGANPDQTDDAGYTPLHAAVHDGHIEVVRLLLSVSDSVNTADKHGNGPLWTAISTTPKDRKVPVIKLLLDAGSDPEHKNIYGKSPREVALESHKDLVEFFNRS